jgi:RNA polymerase sigma-70 factor (ECF subfamily)
MSEKTGQPPRRDSESSVVTNEPPERLASDEMTSTNASLTLAFEKHRPRLFGIAYRMLGSVDDADDLVQDAYLRWQQTDPSALRAPEGWLVAVTTRLAIDRLRRRATERQIYVGDWLPAPLPTAAASQPDHVSEMASDLSVAFLLLLERLAPEERAAFLLREVFDRGYEEIAEVVGRTAVHARQMVHRARERVRAEVPRFRVPPGTQQRLLERFMRAVHDDDEVALLDLLAPQAQLISDSGGKVPAARKRLVGPRRIARFFLGLQRKHHSFDGHRVDSINGYPAVITDAPGVYVSTTSFETDGARIFAIYRVLNPDKLQSVRTARPRTVM